ncbi:MAG: MarC family protein [Phycisphaerales bacterium]
MHSIGQDISIIFGSLLPFLAILNPFALCLYLAGVMDDLESRIFVKVLFWASLISLIVFWIFALVGERLLVEFLGVRTEALRIFGGIIFFVVAYNYVTRGYKAAEVLRGGLEELPSAIALPFMIGAGTITQAILVGKRHGPYLSMFILFLGLCACFLVVVVFKSVRDFLKEEREKVFERYINILSRINGLFIGAISTEMVVSGIRKLWLQT